MYSVYTARERQVHRDTRLAEHKHQCTMTAAHTKQTPNKHQAHCMHASRHARTHTHTHTHTHARTHAHTHTHTLLMALFWHYPGKLVPER